MHRLSLKREQFLKSASDLVKSEEYLATEKISPPNFIFGSSEGKYEHNIQQEIREGLLKHHKSNKDWKNFTEVFFQRMQKDHPRVFEKKEDLNIFSLLISDLEEDAFGKFIAAKDIILPNSNELNFDGFEFYFLVQFYGKFTPKISIKKSEFYGDICCRHAEFTDSISFEGSEFYHDALFEKTTFKNKAVFLGTTFKEKSDFSETKFEASADFSDSKFMKIANFYNSSFSKNTCFEGSLFEEKADYGKVKFYSETNFNKTHFKQGLSLFGSEIESSVRFLEAKIEKKVDFDSIAFGENSELSLEEAYLEGEFITFKASQFDHLSLHHTVFKSPVRFLGEFKNYPDFSKTYFSADTHFEADFPETKKLRITKEDEGKFRFLKNYFEKNGNHFKEREYFACEMKAVEERKKYNKEKDLWLFLLYKENSDYGTDILKPTKGISVALILFFLSFWIFFPKEFTEKPDEKSLAFSSVNTAYFIEQKSVTRQQEINILTESQSLSNKTGKEKSDQTSEASFEQIAAKTFLLTINPLGSFNVAENSSSAVFMLLVGFQAIINTALLFLLALGISNRFKLK